MRHTVLSSATVATRSGMCIYALAGQIKLETNNPDEWTQSRRNYKVASAGIDYAMALCPGDPEVPDLLSDARILLDRAIEIPQAKPDTVFGSMLLYVYLPAFEAQQLGTPLTERHRIAQRLGLAQIIDYIDELPTSDSVRRGMLNKLLLPFAFSRSDTTFLPSLAREGHTRNSKLTGYNHDGRALYDEQWVTIKSRGSREHTEDSLPQILFIPSIVLASQTYPGTLPDAMRGRDLTKGLLVAMQNEARRESIGPHELQWLDRFTHAVVEQGRAFAQDQRVND